MMQASGGSGLPINVLRALRPAIIQQVPRLVLQPGRSIKRESEFRPPLVAQSRHLHIEHHHNRFDLPPIA